MSKPSCETTSLDCEGIGRHVVPSVSITDSGGVDWICEMQLEFGHLTVGQRLVRSHCQRVEFSV